MRTSITHTLVLSGSLLLSSELLGQDDNATKVKSSTLWNMIEQGGWAMIPLGICSLALTYLIIHSLRETNPSRFGTEFFGTRMQSLFGSGKLEEALAAAKQEPTLLGKAFTAALPKLNAENRETDREKRLVVGVALPDGNHMECTLAADHTGQHCLENIAMRIGLAQVSEAPPFLNCF